MNKTAMLALGVIALGSALMTVSPASYAADNENTPAQPSWAFLPGIGKVTVLDFAVEDDTLWLVTPTELIALTAKTDVGHKPVVWTEKEDRSVLVLAAAETTLSAMGPSEIMSASGAIKLQRGIESALRRHNVSCQWVRATSASQLEVLWSGAMRPERFSVMTGYPTAEEILSGLLQSYRAKLRSGRGLILMPNAERRVDRADSAEVQREIDAVMRITPLPADEVQHLLSLPSAARDWGLGWWKGKYLTQFMARQFLYPPQWVRKSR